MKISYSSKIRLLFIVFGIIALFNIGYIVFILLNISDKGLVDFNIYWYSGLFVRQGVNPYEGFLQNLEIALPVTFFDKVINSPSIIFTNPSELPGLPGNTAPFVLFMTLFSFFSLKPAAILWTIVNVGLTVLIPIYILKLLRHTNLNIPQYMYPLSVLLFFSLNMTSRGIIANGQTTLFIFFLMLIALVFTLESRSLLGGIILGLALSKYHVAIPLLIFLIFKRQWKVVITSIIVQFLGIIVLSLLTTTSPILIIKQYALIALYHATEVNNIVQGINISNFFPQSLIYSLLSFLVVTVLVGAIIYYVLIKARKIVKNREAIEMNVLSVLLLWTLLAVYHLGYDAVLTIFPLLLSAVIFINSKKVDMNHRDIVFSVVLNLLALILLILPGSLIRFVFPYNNTSNIAMIIAIVLLLTGNVLFLLNTTHTTRTLES